VLCLLSIHSFVPYQATHQSSAVGDIAYQQQVLFPSLARFHKLLSMVHWSHLFSWYAGSCLKRILDKRPPVWFFTMR